MIEDLLQQLLERLDQRYYGKFRGYVADVEDPLKLGRIQARVPRLLGTTLTGWAMPCSPYAGPDQGFFAVPDVGSGVWIEFEQGDLSRPIWTGAWWGMPEADDIGQLDSTAQRAPEINEVPKHDYPGEIAEPNVRVFKSSTGHQIVLDDRDNGRLEIRDREGNRIILSAEGMDHLVSNQRTVNEGARSSQIDGDDSLELAGDQDETVGGNHTREVTGDTTITIKGSYTEKINGAGFTRTIDRKGVNETVGGPVNENVRGSFQQTVSGKIDMTGINGIGLNAGLGNLQASGKSVKIAALLPDPLNCIDLQGLFGNISINTFVGFCQLGGMSAISPMVLGDGLFMHFVMLAALMRTVNPMLAIAYGPVFDTWAAMTPALDWSMFARVKRLPVG
jgi:type VI secretion system secreted protein VgrG